ncbi:MAG: hypothetical protein KME54_02750 [Tolypothrix brevis GSE-NOS-MK-07-07A]|nr:hypothetical protein [Tolypothrix brevis GSE-NOS-MK-07-07A]
MVVCTAATSIYRMWCYLIPPLTNRSSIWEEKKLLSLSERLVIGDISFISVVHKAVEAIALDRIY